tara:strand:+ start:700 stop:1110 length:411 start_codon:yes stop_codon:yes gene_type:complete
VGDVFKKLSCNAKQVVVDKKSDDTLEIIVVDSVGDTHTINVAIKTEATQNIDILGDRLEQYTDVSSLEVSHEIKKSDKYVSTEISMKWNHTEKPSVFEIKSKDKIVFTGSFSDAMIWVNNNIKECDQKSVTKKSHH